MMKRYLFCLFSVLFAVSATAYELQRVSVHDPSIVWDPSSKTYYIFGSHRAVAKTTDLMSWTTVGPVVSTTAFKTPAVKKVKKGGVEYDLDFNAEAWSRRGSASYDISGNLWAPDVIWNPIMKKWCMYMSVNGDNWYSSIVLLTADQIEGPYTYQAPVVISGFQSGDSYKDTDLEVVIGTQSSLPERYDVGGNGWRTRWPNCIDPCVFYDEKGKLWMTYGSWFGGIFMLELDENTGLRDYDVTYELTGSGDGITIDPYYGKKIAGGHGVSGEASYMEYIGGYYFLFVTYGGLTADGGYQIRVFRSEKPDGPYEDVRGTAATYINYRENFGANATDSRGVNIFGAYGDWGNQTMGKNSERSQGHNSIIAAEDGRTYLVYHTRFQNRSEEHEVRVHQVFQNEDGWLVAAPFEYTGEQVKSADIATSQQIPTSQIAGNYKLLTHKFKLDHTRSELATPVDVQLNADGTISGEVSGKWSVKEGTSYMTIQIGNDEYKGVMVEQTLEPTSEKAAAFTAVAKNGVTIWGYKPIESTGIRDAKTGLQQDDRIYDLSGRLVTTPLRKGIYIRNGKKYVHP
jgi:arabinan endo-1,5-alpha-L-arabinosidase